MMHQGNHDPRADMNDATRSEANAYSMPSVADQGQDRMTLGVGAAALMLLGLVVFNQLSEGRRGASVDERAAQTRLALHQAQTDAAAARRDARQAQAEALRAQRQLAASSRRPPEAGAGQKTNDRLGKPVCARLRWLLTTAFNGPLRGVKPASPRALSRRRWPGLPRQRFLPNGSMAQG